MAVKQPWTLTLRQYERAIMDDYMERTGEDACSKAEYLRCYPNDCRLSEWVREIEEAIDHHESIPAKVLDDVFRRCPDRVGWAFLKRMNAHGPIIDYMPPYIRARQKALKRDEIEMKRRVRSMVRGN